MSGDHERTELNAEHAKAKRGAMEVGGKEGEPNFMRRSQR